METAEAALDRRQPAGRTHDLDTLLRDIAAGDEEALMRLYYSSRRGVFAVSYAITRDYQLSEDVLQETMIRIWSHAAGYRGDGYAKSWILAIARNLSIDTMKKRGRLVSVEDFEDQLLPEALTTRVDYDDRLALLAGIDCLDREEALAFTLKAVAGLSHLECARLMELPYHTVRYRYHTAIGKLKIYLSGPDPASGQKRSDRP